MNTDNKNKALIREQTVQKIKKRILMIVAKKMKKKVLVLMR
jgi:hypothetical protein